MASAGSLLSEDTFLCPICLDVFTRPVTTPCGHNFCRDCLHGYWTTTSVCQCPMCKHKFYRRPELQVNTFISEMAIQFRMSVDMKASPGLPQNQNPLPPGEVACDVCPGRGVRALKTCLDCLASYCKTHLEAHLVLPSFRNHQLISPLMSVADRVCQKHQRLLETFCRTDQAYTCQECAKSHRGHSVVSLEEESSLRRAQLDQVEAKTQQMIRSRQQSVSEIRKTVQLSKRNMEREVKESLEVFSALVRSLQRSQAELVEAIQEKEMAAERRAEELVSSLEQEIAELRVRSVELERLSLTEDHLHLLRSFPSSSGAPASREQPKVGFQGVVYVGTVRRALRRVGSQLEEAVRAEVKRLCDTELRRIQEWEADVTLDPDTAHPKLLLSDDGKQVRHGETALSLPDSPARFYPGISVLGRQGFSSGRFYCEVLVKGKAEWDIGVGRESVNRKGSNTLTPEAGYWTLGLRNVKEYWALAKPPVPLPLVDRPQTVGMYVDWEGGQVSFYDVEARSHIYSFTGYSFAEKLFPYFNPRRNNGGVNSAPLVISPVNHT